MVSFSSNNEKFQLLWGYTEERLNIHVNNFYIHSSSCRELQIRDIWNITTKIVWEVLFPHSHFASWWWSCCCTRAPKNIYFFHFSFLSSPLSSFEKKNDFKFEEFQCDDSSIIKLKFFTCFFGDFRDWFLVKDSFLKICLFFALPWRHKISIFIDEREAKKIVHFSETIEPPLE